MNKKKILSLALVVLLIATISFGTLAWFNDTAEVKNTFYVATSDEEGTPDFGITVEEKQLDTGDFEPEGNEYKDILPGDVLPKHVNVANTGHYEQWVRVHVTFSDSAVWQKAIAEAAAEAGMDFKNYVIYKMIKSPSTELCETPIVVSYNVFGEDTMTFTYYYGEPLKENSFIYFMKEFSIPGALEQDDMKFGDDGFTLTVKADAVQVKNLEATKASEAFAEVNWPIGAEYNG